MERLYQYVWKNGLLGRRAKLDDGRELTIKSPGRLNTDAGPDFQNAMLAIASQQWAGDVEIHVRASDWYAHGHHNDAAYDSVILHVVAHSDRGVQRGDGSTIPQLTATFPQNFFALYSTLCEGIGDVKCKRQLAEFIEDAKNEEGLHGSSMLTLETVLESLAVERLQQKAQRIITEVNNLGGDWERGCLVALARALGFGLNGEPFEILARSLPLNILHRHCDNLLQLEALFFGQAGMLDTSIHIFDEYYQTLCREYFFLARKYGLRPMRREMWKYARTRPQNFPHRRIALLARAVEGGYKMLSDILAAGCDVEKLNPLLNIRAEGYWLTHSDFDVENHGGPIVLSAGSMNLLMINFVAPLLYAYGATYGDADSANRGLELWQQLPAEGNQYIRNWKSLGLKCHDAARSQALLQLRREYCDRDRCLECALGCKLLRNAMSR